MQNNLGIDSELIAPDSLDQYFSEIRIGECVAGTYYGGGGFADPHLALQGFSQRAQEIGVDIQTHTSVTDICTDDGAVVGVEADAERVSADFVVNAAGAWAGRVADFADISLPVSPKRR
jgi:sarcosine oxidase subunit beta